MINRKISGKGIALAAAYALALQALLSAFAAPRLAAANAADQTAVICGTTGPAGEGGAPSDRRAPCDACVLAGGCAGHGVAAANGTMVEWTASAGVAIAAAGRPSSIPGPVSVRHRARAPPSAA